jgi:hypothetical protein
LKVVWTAIYTRGELLLSLTQFLLSVAQLLLLLTLLLLLPLLT